MSTQQATITSAVALSEIHRTSLQKALDKKYPGIKIVEKVDPSVLGGVKVTVGSTQIDATISGKIAQYKKFLNS